MIIAIDGFSSTGKSSLAKSVAKTLGIVHIDSGAMYRAVTLFALENRFIDQDSEVFDKQSLINTLDQMDLKFIYNPEIFENEVYLNGKNISKQIREKRVDQWVSKVAKLSEVRAFLLQKQRAFADDQSLVMDGRDIGSNVFKDADIKLFITADLKERGKRRYLELKQNGQEQPIEEVVNNLNDRDFVDVNRKESPLKKAEDAIEIDNTDLSFEQTLDLVLQYISKLEG